MRWRRTEARCVKASCVHFYREGGTAGRCRLGLRFDSCTSFTPKPPKPRVPFCDLKGCAHYYREDWRGRCRLGLRHKARRGESCPRYEPRGKKEG